MGAVNIYTRELARHVVTVVGEAPVKTVQKIRRADFTLIHWRKLLFFIF